MEQSENDRNSKNNNSDNMSNITTIQPSHQYLEAYIRASSFLINHQQQLQNYQRDPFHQAATLQIMALQGGAGSQIRPSSPTGSLQQSSLPRSPRWNLQGSSSSMIKGTELMPQTSAMHQGSVHLPRHNLLTSRLEAGATSPMIPPPGPSLNAIAPGRLSSNLYLTGNSAAATTLPIVTAATTTPNLILRQTAEQASRTAIGNPTSFLEGKVPATTIAATSRSTIASRDSSSDEDSTTNAKASLKPTPNASTARSTQKGPPPPQKPQREYIDKVHMLDVLCGRGGRSNRHPGNQIYRRLVLKMKDKYRIIGCNEAKKDLSMEIVQSIQESGGRFIKLDRETGKFYLLTLSEARKKTSQALREIRSPIWT